jgi:hypothetical protein
MLRELSVAEQRYQAVLAVIEDGLTVTEVAARAGVTRPTMHSRPTTSSTWHRGHRVAGRRGLSVCPHGPRGCMGDHQRFPAAGWTHAAR